MSHHSFLKNKTRMNRREFMNKVGMAGGALACYNALPLASPLEGGRRTRRRGGSPNIMLIMTDQQHHRAVGAFGNQHLNTPAMDRLVRSGVSFENSYCSNPVCMPSRSSILTGVMPTESNVWINTAHQGSGGHIHPSVPHLGKWLRNEADYETVYAGKYHLPGCNTFDIPDFTVISAGVDHRGDIGDMQVSRACESYLRRRGRGEGEKPFFMVCSLVQPHDICHWLNLTTTGKGGARYDSLDDVEERPGLPPNFDFDRNEPQVQKDIRARQQPHAGGWDEEDWRYYLWSYDRHVEMVDAEIGRVLRALDETGQTEDTLIVFTSDHGEGAAEHQMVRKAYLYESAIRVPLIFSFPGRIHEDRTENKSVVSGIDLMPTLCDYAGIKAPQNVHSARSLRPLLEGTGSGLDREGVVVELNEPARRSENMEESGRAIRTERFKYIRFFNDQTEQLFDMKDDPYETTNLAETGRYSDVIKDHRKLLAQWEASLNYAPDVPDNCWHKLI